MSKKKVNAILPMRAGSQRIKNKNIKRINNKPLYQYIIDTLLHSINIDIIFINTDIAEVIEKYKSNDKIYIIEREDHLKGNCSMNLVIEDTINKISGYTFIQVHATNPLLKSETINIAIDTYYNNLLKYDSLFSVTKTQKRFWKMDGTPLNHNPDAPPTTQDLKPYYEENSCLYVFSRESFQKKKNRIGERPYLFETDLLESIDIDTEEELRLIEKILE